MNFQIIKLQAKTSRWRKDYETADKEYQGCLNKCSNFQIIKLERKNIKVAWKPLVSFYVRLENFVIGHTAPQLWVVWWLVKSYSWRSRAILGRYFKKQKLEWMMWLGSVCSQRYNSGSQLSLYFCENNPRWSQLEWFTQRLPEKRLWLPQEVLWGQARMNTR